MFPPHQTHSSREEHSNAKTSNSTPHCNSRRVCFHETAPQCPKQGSDRERRREKATAAVFKPIEEMTLDPFRKRASHEDARQAAGARLAAEKFAIKRIRYLPRPMSHALPILIRRIDLADEGQNMVVKDKEWVQSSHRNRMRGMPSPADDTKARLVEADRSPQLWKKRLGELELEYGCRRATVPSCEEGEALLQTFRACEKHCGPMRQGHTQSSMCLREFHEIAVQRERDATYAPFFSSFFFNVSCIR